MARYTSRAAFERAMADNKARPKNATPDRGRVHGDVEPPVWNWLNTSPYSRAGAVRLACIMDWLLRECPEYSRLRRSVAQMYWPSIMELDHEIHTRPLRIIYREEDTDGD